MKKIIRLLPVFLCVLMSSLSLFGRSTGYEIKIVIADIPTSKVFLVGYYGLDTWIADSANVSSMGAFVFSSDKKLPKGFYCVVDTADKEYMQLIVDQSSFFSVKTSMKELQTRRIFKNTDENSIFFEFQKQVLMCASQSENPNTVYRAFSQVSPESLLSKFASAVTPAERVDTPYLFAHYFDAVDLNDVRLLRVPMVPARVMDYFEKVLPLEADSMLKYTDAFLDGIYNREVKEFYLQRLFKFYGGYLPVYDEVLVHLYDTYCPDGECAFMDASQQRSVKNKVARKRKLIPGANVPVIETYQADGQVLSTDSLKSKYVVLWVWDPDCDDCVELTPVLHKLYEEYAAQFDFDVYAVAMNESAELWLDFVDKHGLSWHNTSFAAGEPNFDLQDYFDIMTTPFILLMDENRKIVDKQFPITGLLNLMK